MSQSFLFIKNQEKYLIGGSTIVFSNLYTPLTNLVATSTKEGEIVLNWSGGMSSAIYSYSLSSGTIQRTSGTNPTTITLTTLNSVTTIVTLSFYAFDINYTFTSNSVTTPVPPPDILWLKCNSTTYSGTGGVLTNSASSGSTYNCNYWSENGTLQLVTFGGGPVLKLVSTSTVYYMVTSPYLPMPSNNVVGKGFTICFWFYPSVYGINGSRLVSLGNNGNNSTSTAIDNGVFTIWNFSDGTTLQFVNAGSNGFTNANYPIGSWYHLAYTSSVVTVNSTAAGSASTKLYFNGTSTNITGLLNANINPTASFNFNFAYGSTIYYSDIRIYGKELSSAEISGIYTTGRPTS